MRALTHHVREVDAVLQRAGRFDIVHFHIDPLYYMAVYGALLTRHGMRDERVRDLSRRA